MLLGTDGLGIKFDNYKHAQIIGMVALTIILFTGGMDTKFSDIKPILGAGVVLSTLGVLLTTLFTGLFLYGISHLFPHTIQIPLTMALLLAATMSSTDSATVNSSTISNTRQNNPTRMSCFRSTPHCSPALGIATTSF